LQGALWKTHGAQKEIMRDEKMSAGRLNERQREGKREEEKETRI